MRLSSLLLVLLCSACGGSPTAPSMPAPPVTPATYTISGQLTATNGGHALNASLDFGVAATTTQNGSYSVAVPVTAPTLSLTIAGAGLVTRRAYVTPGTRTVNLDAISESGFDLTFYRQFVRNTLDAPGRMEPLRRWTKAPQVYIRTVRDDGAAVESDMLTTAENVIRDSMPRWSGGFAPVSVVRGAETRIGQAGWLTIAWPRTVGADRVCGRADVAVSGGVLQLFIPTANACGCDNTTRLRPGVVRHELGHAMGFSHTDGAADVMAASSTVCDVPISARERYHAAIAYSRPIGNTDPDIDPAGAVNLAPMRVQ